MNTTRPALSFGGIFSKRTDSTWCVWMSCGEVQVSWRKVGVSLKLTSTTDDPLAQHARTTSLWLALPVAVECAVHKIDMTGARTKSQVIHQNSCTKAAI